LKRAVAHGLANSSALTNHPTPLSLEDGRKLYEDHMGRDRVMFGVKPSSRKRYWAVVDKLLAFAKSGVIRTWKQVDAALVQKYGAHLQQEDYAYATRYLELTNVKQIVGWLTRAGHLVWAKPIALPLRKPRGTSTYCWRPDEVQAMVAHCRAHPELRWLAGVIVALS
jgi:hypothetical protein